MADGMTVKIIRREPIKPCSPTPQHLRILKLSMLDQFTPEIYVPLVLFYPFSSSIKSQTIQQNPVEIAYERLQCLRKTLSKSLNLYYPFAGRLNHNLQTVECNDQGAEFIEAKASVQMSEILKNPDPDSLTNLIAALYESNLESHGGFLLLVQATIFDCGGIALGLSISHKIADAFTISGFIESWANIARKDPEPLTKPEFGLLCDLFPPITGSLSSEPSEQPDQEECVTKRFVFSAEKIAALKRSIIASGDGLIHNPTKVEAVSGLVWKCAAPRSSCWLQVMNLRKRIVPPLGDNVAGNLVSGFLAKTDDLDLPVLVSKLRKGIEEAAISHSDKTNISRTVLGQVQESAAAMKSNKAGFYLCSSWCRFGFYEADFGWEKPTWVSIVSFKMQNSVVLMDTKDGDGIEAWLIFSGENMASIETNQEFLDFACLNPSVI